MNDIVISKHNKLLLDKIHMDFNLIEMPLFSQNAKAKQNIGAVYVIDKKRNIMVEVIPGAGLSIPNDFDQKVYLALVQIAMEFKDKHGLTIINNKVYTTYYEIFSKLHVAWKGNINERIGQSLDKLKATVYHLWNCCYQADTGIIGGKFSASFINDIKIMPKNSNSAKEAMTYVGSTKSDTIIELTLHSFFLHNILHKRGNLIHEYTKLITLEDTVARVIYLHCEKNRAWVGKKFYGTDKKMKITANKLARTIPLAWVSNNVPKTIIRIRQAFEFLKNQNMITDFVEYKGKPLSETWYEVGFGWSRDDKEYIMTGRENFDITSVAEIEINPSNFINIEEMKEIDLSSGCPVVTKIISNNAIDSKSNNNYGDIAPELLKLIEPIKNKIGKKTLNIINQVFLKNGLQYVHYSINYAEQNAKTNFDKYLQDTLLNEWALAQQLQDIESINQSHQKKIDAIKRKDEESRVIDQKNKQDSFNKNEVEHEFHKLNDFTKEHYINAANNILRKYNDKLKPLLHDDPENKLALSIFAISNNRYYNRVVELYCKNMLSIDLNIYKFKDDAKLTPISSE